MNEQAAIHCAFIILWICMWLFYSFTAEVAWFHYYICHKLPPYVIQFIATLIVTFYFLHDSVCLCFLNGYVIAFSISLYVFFKITHSSFSSSFPTTKMHIKITPTIAPSRNVNIYPIIFILLYMALEVVAMR